MTALHDQIYCSFLLRIWVEPDGDGSWRFSLEDTQTGIRKGFVSLRDLCQHIEQLLARTCDHQVDN